MIVEAQQTPEELLTVDLKEATEAENEDVLEQIDEYVDAAGEEDGVPFTPVPQLETLRNTLATPGKDSVSTLVVIDAIRALPDFAVQIDRREDHTPPEYVWHNGFRFVGIQSGGESVSPAALQDYPFPRLVHFTSVYPVSVLPLSETPFEE